MNHRNVLQVFAAVLGACLTWCAQASGGHHAVEDAGLLEPGQCQVEIWQERGTDHRLTHAGPGCRLGPVELALNVDRLREGGTTTVWGPQVKWGTELGAGWSLGAVWLVNLQDHRPKFSGHTLVLPLTWQASEDFALHLNLGRDVLRGAADRTRRGAALEWQATQRLQLLTEWWDDGSLRHRRAGLRVSLQKDLTLDFSRARHNGPEGQGWWTLGLGWVFDR
ncbi:hypothetical protein ACG0Z6_03215 [Roseateles sp. BYS180W]|uniref:Transporter n=1 Tax=Roseateles rivi TaxID=3299028 RepID=A0ABW7FSE3_9BURK